MTHGSSRAQPFRGVQPPITISHCPESPCKEAWPGALRMRGHVGRETTLPGPLCPLNRITRGVPQPVSDLCPKRLCECVPTKMTPDDPSWSSCAQPRLQNHEPINGCHCFKSLSFGVACHTAIVSKWKQLPFRTNLRLNLAQ